MSSIVANIPMLAMNLRIYEKSLLLMLEFIAYS